MTPHKKKQSLEEYKGLLNQEGQHTYAKKRQAAHLARISTIENLLPLCGLDSKSSKAYQEAQNIIQLERKKYGTYQPIKKESDKR